jgi:hypothetical protein
VIEAEAEEVAFSAVEAKTGEGEAAGHLLEPEPLVERDRSRVAGVGEEPGVCGTSLIQSRRAWVRAAPMPVRRSLGATKTPVR